MTKLRHLTPVAALAATIVLVACGGGGGGSSSGTSTTSTTASTTSTTTTTASTTSTTASTTSTSTTTGTTTTTIVGLANAYGDSLSTTQQTATVLTGNATNAAKWSNLPATPSGSGGANNLRNGVAYSSLASTTQTNAWTALVSTALGADGSNAYDQFTQIRASDDYLGTLQSGYSGGYEYVAFVGTPSTSSSWLLQIGGHHVANNYTYTGNALTSTTPYFLGVEPQSFTSNGTTYTPLSGQRTAMLALLNSLGSAEQGAKLTSSFSDVYLGPGKDARSNFPTTGRGLLYSSLDSASQALVMPAIQQWTKNSPLASTYDALYQSELSQTYVAYSGTTSTASTFGAQGDYVRIDGPHVWIEFVCQNGVVISGQIHFHTVWRDRVTDYNQQYYQ